MTGPGGPPRWYRRFMGLPYIWWRHLPHWHVPVYLNEVGHTMCAICWLPLDLSIPGHPRRAGGQP